MKISRMLSAALLACALIPPSTSAQSMYGSLSGLYVMPTDSDLSAPLDEGISLVLEAEMDQGMGGAIALGYGSALGFRGEIEASYRANDLDNILGVKVKGDQSAMSLMLNGLYVIEAEKVNPYIGAGIGFAKREVTMASQVIDGQAIPRTSDQDTVFAYQGMVGIIYPTSETMEFRLGYRYFGAGDAELEDDDEEGTVKLDYGAHNLEAGVTIRF